MVKMDNKIIDELLIVVHAMSEEYDKMMRTKNIDEAIGQNVRYRTDLLKIIGKIFNEMYL